MTLFIFLSELSGSVIHICTRFKKENENEKMDICFTDH